MFDQPQLGVIIVVALYALAGVLALIGGVMALRLRRRRQRHE